MAHQSVLLALGYSAALTAVLWLIGCQLTPETTPKCAFPQSTDVAHAFKQTRTELERRECHFHFDTYFEHLLETATGDPNPKNSKYFSEFLLWANAQNIITRRNAQEYYNRYFNTKFVSLPNEYSNCAYTCRKQEEIVQQMREELQQKDRGLLKITGNKRAYAEANSLHDSVLLLLEATCTACTASSP